MIRSTFQLLVMGAALAAGLTLAACDAKPSQPGGGATPVASPNPTVTNAAPTSGTVAATPSTPTTATMPTPEGDAPMTGDNATSEAWPRMTGVAPSGHPRDSWHASLQPSQADGMWVVLVQGTVVAPNPGYTISIEPLPATPGTNRIALALHEKPGNGPAIQVLSPKRITYRTSVPEGNVPQVVIQYDDGDKVELTPKESQVAGG